MTLSQHKLEVTLYEITQCPHDKITLIINQLASSPFYAQSKNELLDVVYQLGVYRIDVQAHLLIGSDNIFFQLKYADDAKLQQKIDNCILWADIIHNHYYDVCASLKRKQISSLMFGREASGFNHWRDSPRLVKVDSHCRLS